MHFSKGNFHKVAKDHLTVIHALWNAFDNQARGSLIDTQTMQITIQKFNQDLFRLSMKLDKCLMLVVACSFNLNDLMTNPENNDYVHIVKILV